MGALYRAGSRASPHPPYVPLLRHALRAGFAVSLRHPAFAVGTFPRRAGEGTFVLRRHKVGITKLCSTASPPLGQRWVTVLVRV